MSASSFLSTLVAILNEQEEILELPNNRLNASTCKGDVVEGEIQTKVFLKIARLQTLIVKSREDTQMPDYETTQQIADQTGVDFITAEANALAVSEDSTYRVMMLERLIVEIVRQNFPKECGQFKYNYFARLDGKIVRAPIREQRFLD